MAYTKTTWIDRNVSTPLDYVATKGGGGALSSGDTLTMTASAGVVTAAGTPITASDMNNIEDGVEAVTDATWFLLDSDTLSSSVATFDIAVPSGYDKYKVVFSGLPTVSSTELRCKLNGYSTNVYNYILIQAASAIPGFTSSANFSMCSTTGFRFGSFNRVELIITNPDSVFTYMDYTSQFHGGNSTASTVTINGLIAVSEVLDTVTLFPTANQIASGAIWKLYGLKT